ncbi:MAG: ABC transporter ATP-binding protein [Candidatus Helarchaeota archaeon]
MEKGNETLIQLKNLTKKFGNFYAVSNINLEIKYGEILGFLGPNGAGKSTTMKMMARLLNPNSGEIWINNNGNLEKLTSKTKDHLLDNIGFLIETPAFYMGTTPRILLSYFAKLKGYPRNKVKKQVEMIVKMVGLENWIDKKFKTFSKGMRQKVGIISAIVHNPDIIVLDEPFTGLDPKARKEVRDFILKLRDLGKTIFLSSHLLYEVSEVADRVAMISHGKIVACDTLDNLEAKAKKSLIRLELLNMQEDNINMILEKIKNIISPFTGLDDNKEFITYKSDSKIIEILFNGDPTNQLQILRSLISNNIEVIDFSVPKAGLLENLYLDIMSHSDETYIVHSKLRQKKGDIKIQS